jgi:hypothetical protein
MIWAWFKNTMESIRKGRSFRIPSIIKFISSKPEIMLITTNLTKAEIFRYLKSNWNCERKLSEEIWGRFLRSFNVLYVEVKGVDINDLINICSTIPTKKKTMVNLLHIQIAKRENLWFVTGEERLKEKYKQYYDKILTYKDIRKAFS